MALLDFLKNKKEKDKSAEKKAQKVSVVKKDVTKSEPVKEFASAKVAPKKGKFSYDIVKEPHISEKATYLADEDKYVFKVYPAANKLEIKKSVEGIYGVDVLAVNIVNIPRKKRRVGRTEGFKKGFKKALVTLKKGQKIEIF